MKMKLILIFFFVIIILSSCIKNNNIIEDTNFSDLTNNQKNLLIRLIATGYNKGGNYNFEELKELSNDINYKYDDDVLEFYKYFTGEINNTIKTKNIDNDPHYDPDIKNYIKNITENHFNNNSSEVFLIDYFDEKIPVNSDINFFYLNPKIIDLFEKRNFLVDRVYKKIKEYYFSSSTFKQWFDYFYKDKALNDSDIKKYSEFLVDIVYTYVNSNIELKRLHYTSSELYPNIIKLNHIPIELILSIIMKESRFFPGSFRAELDNNGNIYALSFGLTHILIDANFLEIPNIGDENIGERNFDLISYFYLGNKRNEETYFSDWDLITIRGSILYAVIYLDMLYQKIIKYIEY
ncbi:hypothetical protein JCM30566_11460 [Marinitoga arctica]